MNMPWHGRTPPTTCESGSWPYSADPAVFEARRAVGQMVRTISALESQGESPSPAVLSYIAATDAISKALREDVLPELVAEARAHGVGWAEIGKSLGVRDTAAQKRFGKGPTQDSARSELAEEERSVVHLSNELLSWEPRGEDALLMAEIREELEGTTAADRVKYAFALIRGSYASFKKAEGHLKLPEQERDEDAFIGLLYDAQQKLMNLVQTLVADSAQWEAIADWAEVPKTPDASHYYAPATYMFYAFRQVMLACNYSMRAVGTPGLDPNERMRLFATANQILEVTMLVFSRSDVQSALPRG
ncbi:hypothetical protein [Actinomadura sp. NPDC000600]|uniref:hypothetical protein n=1 Tax=Actinomadura sp. NPDC000600 TaxID=3154262 RepID=UPI00339249DC